MSTTSLVKESTEPATLEPMQANTEHQLLTFREAMRFLRVSSSTVYRLIWSGQLRGHKVGSTWRFYMCDLEECVRLVGMLPPSTQEEMVNDTVKSDGETSRHWKGNQA